MKPILSIIIPCFNNAKFLRSNFDSILQQSFTNWECIVVNDGSTDNSCEIILDYCRKYSNFVYIFQDNKGTANARNVGVSHAKGIFLHFLDADDIIACDIYNNIFRMMNEKNIDIIYGNFCYIDSSGNVIKRIKTSKVRKNIVISIYLESGIFPIHAAIIRRAVFLSLCGFDNDCYVEDYDFWIRASLSNFKFYKIDRTMCGYRIAHNETKSSKIEKMVIAKEKVLQRYIDSLPIKKESDRNAILSIARIGLFSFYCHEAVLDRNISAYDLLSTKLRKIPKIILFNPKFFNYRILGYFFDLVEQDHKNYKLYTFFISIRRLKRKFFTRTINPLNLIK